VEWGFKSSLRITNKWV